jgi:hypothetical protein
MSKLLLVVGELPGLIVVDLKIDDKPTKAVTIFCPTVKNAASREPTPLLTM